MKKRIPTIDEFINEAKNEKIPYLPLSKKRRLKNLKIKVK